jgi:hypothetical protein
MQPEKKTSDELVAWVKYMDSASDKARPREKSRFCRRLDPRLAALSASAMMFSFSVEEVDGR